MSTGFCACDTREKHPASECVRPGAGDDEVALEDVRAVCRELGLGTHARPYSAHAVIHREVLPAIRALHTLASEMINDPESSAADYGYDLAYRLGMLGSDDDEAAR